MKTPGQRIKEERDQKGWSQQKLADEISRIKKEKISRAAVSLWESGTSKSQKPDNFFAAAQALGLNPYWVLNESGEKYLPHSSNSSGKTQCSAPAATQEGGKSSQAKIPEVANRVAALDSASQQLVSDFIDVLEKNGLIVQKAPVGPIKSHDTRILRALKAHITPAKNRKA